MSHDEKNPIREDLGALRTSTQRNLPSQDDTAWAVHARRVRAAREGITMKIIRSISRRPIVATAFGIAVVAVMLLAIPISFERTIGYEARLTLPSVDPAQCEGIASEFAKVLKTKEFNYNQDVKEGTTISARVPVRSRRVIEGLAMAYAQALAARGISARSQVLPVTQRISGNVYAAAANEIIEIHVSRDGKTNEQIATEIREQLAAAGLPGAEVDVTQEGGQTRMQMTWQCPPGDTLACEKQINVSIDGSQEQQQGQRMQFKVRSDHPMSDAEMKAAIEAQIRAQGKDADVTVQNGKVTSVQIRK